VRIHVIETGRLRSNETFMRADGWRSALLRGRRDFEFPVQSFVIEHPEGLVAIDAGLGAPPTVPRWQRRFVPVPVGAPTRTDERLRSIGIDPADVSRLVLTHLDWDHVGGVGAFPHAEVLVHRPEHEAATSRAGRMRYQPGRWPEDLRPTLYDLDDGPTGPFPCSHVLTERGDIHLVPLPGHSAGQVGVLVAAGETTLLFAADHMLRWDWFREDSAAGRQLGLGIFYPRAARETSRRVLDLVEERGAVVLPSHDDATPGRLATALGAETLVARGERL
jgi:glyoxylase-like metal-dependent hydrolase (beta-lactamase superfamily II)